MFFNFNLKTKSGEISFRVRDEKTVVIKDNMRLVEIRTSIEEIEYNEIANVVYLTSSKNDNGDRGFYKFDVAKLTIPHSIYREDEILRYDINGVGRYN